MRVETTIPGHKPFTEGPAVDADGNVFFTNTGEILKWEPAAMRLSTFRKPGNGANGQAFDAQGRLLTCEAPDTRCFSGRKLVRWKISARPPGVGAATPAE